MRLNQSYQIQTAILSMKLMELSNWKVSNISGRKADNKYSCGKTSKIERTASYRHHLSVNARTLNECPEFPMSNVMKFRAYETRKASDVASRLRPG